MADAKRSKMLSPKEAAALLELSPSTLSKWRTRREGPPWYKRGKRLVHYYESEILAWLDGCDAQPGSRLAGGRP